MSRWLVLVAALAFAVVVGWSLLTALQGGESGAPATATARAVASPPRVDRVANPAPEAHISKSSRDALRDILRDADEDGS